MWYLPFSITLTIRKNRTGWQATVRFNFLGVVGCVACLTCARKYQ